MVNSISWQNGLTKSTRFDSLTVAGVTAALVTAANTDSDMPAKSKAIILSSSVDEKEEQESSSIPFVKGNKNASLSISF